MYEQRETVYEKWFPLGSLEFKNNPPRSTIQVYKGESGDWPFHFDSTNLPHAENGSRRGCRAQKGSGWKVGDGLICCREELTLCWDGLSHGKTLSDFPKALSVFSSLQLSSHWIQLSCEQEQLLADGSRCGDEVEAKWNVRAPCMPTNRLSIGLSAISVERDGSYFISKEGRRKRRGFLN